MFPLYTALIIIYIALVQINLNYGNELFPVNITEITIALLFLIFVPAFLIIWETIPLNKLCRKIIKGELTEYSDILSEYEKFEKKYKFFRKK
jgi:hypothetical protein